MKKALLFLTLIIILVESCKSKFEPLNESDADEFQAVLDNKLINKGHPGASIKQIRKQWMKLYSDCFKNDIFKSPNYLGLTNVYGVGTLVNKDDGELVRSLANIIPESEFSKFIKYPPFAPICSDANKTNFDFNIALNAAISNITDIDFKTQLKKANQVKIVAGNWRQINSTVGDLNSYIDTSKASGMEEFRKSRDEKNIYMITAVLEVSSFSSTLSFDSDLEIGLKSKYPQDSIIKVPNAGINGGLQIKRTSDREITVSATSLFIPLVVCSKKH